MFKLENWMYEEKIYTLPDFFCVTSYLHLIIVL